MRAVFLMITVTCVCAAQSVIVNLKDLTERIEQSPTAALYLARATEFLRLGDTQLAIGDYSDAIRLGKSEPSADAFTGRGIAYIALQQFTPAIDDFTRAIQLKPDAVLPYLERGFAYAQIGNVQLAITGRTA